jgi:predicted DNA-binding protein with PD1-like motif
MIKNYFVKATLLLFGAILFFSFTEQMTKTHVIRLKPGEKLKELIQQYVNTNHIKAGWISSCVGSLTKYNLRFANQPSEANATGHFEIVSLTGTLSENGSHLHMSISDSTGKVIGGHLLDGNIVFTTAEIVILEDPGFEFKREKDGTTDWPELQINGN